MNKGYDELVSNHLPHRQPLHKIDRQVVQGMQGFGLGLPEEIEHKLEQIIRSPEYQYAAKQIDQNYQGNHNNTESSQQQQQQQQQHNSLTRWRRTVSIRRTASSLHSKPRDDPQSLPAMYDPLISIYYLKEENSTKRFACWRAKDINHPSNWADQLVHLYPNQQRRVIAI
ncbi:Putative CAMK/CAMKL/KIN1 protein kinase [Rhizopus microsporus]|nr:Putative CAMK/CAMKL/KIN1 protein kinase [Rhizopus microsporus]